MAKISSEEAVKQIGNRYDLILVAAIRQRELNRGMRPKVKRKHGNHLTALEEIEEGHIGKDYLKKVRG